MSAGGVMDGSPPRPLPAYAFNSQNFCRVPAHASDGEFWAFSVWVNKACSWIGGTNPLCVVAWGRMCSVGADFMRADAEGSFPVRFWYGEGGQTVSEKRRSKAAHKRAMKLHYPWRFS